MSVEKTASESATRSGLEQFQRLRLPVDVTVSADGTRVAFAALASCAEKGGRLASTIWTLEVGERAEQVTQGSGTAVAPRWAPSGALAFASDHEHTGRMSVYIREADRVRQVGEIAGSVEDLAWSADGTRLLVLAADLGADRAGIQAATKIQEQTAAEVDPQVTRPFQAWRRLYSVDARSGETVEVSPTGVNVFEFDWDGASGVAAVCSDDPSESAWYGAYLGLLDVERGTIARVYEPEWQIAVPRFAGDGSTICFVEGFCSDRGVLAGTVRAIALASGVVRDLAPDLDVSWLQPGAGSSLWYAGWRGMGSMCGRLSLDGTVEEVWAGDATIGSRYQPALSVDARGRLLVAAYDAPGRAPEVVVRDARAPDGWRPLTELNPRAPALLETVEQEAWTWSARDDVEIEGILLRPRGVPGPLPLIVIVHGGPTGVWSHQFAPFLGIPYLLAAEGYGVLLPNPRGSAGRGQQFARANLGDMGGGDLGDILDGVDSLVDAGITDAERLGITGASYGGFMAAWAVTQTDRFSAAIPIACVSDWRSFHLTTNIGRFDELFLNADPYEVGGEYEARSPVVHASSCTTPTLVMHGGEDLCTPLGQAKELYQALVDAGVETELVVYPREGHGWLERAHQHDAWERIRDWFARYVKGE
ncbi:MAG: S9 family peptidase [Actinomycetota bacterium]|nr:S9 family peptidase [Actinomycetota bacterium]